MDLNNLFSISEIAEAVNGKIEGDPKLKIKGVCDLQNGQSGHIAYILPGKYENYLKDTKATALLTNNSFKIDQRNKTLIRVNNPALSFIDIIHMFYPNKPNCDSKHPSAVVAENATLGTNVERLISVVSDVFNNILGTG